jgi:hypothetical protein
MIVSWRLWQMLRQPPVHFQNATRYLWFRRYPVYRLSAKTDAFSLIRTITLIFAVFASLHLVVLLIMLGFAASALIVNTVMHTLRNLTQAIIASGIIAHERQQNRYDTMKLLPPGELGYVWTVYGRIAHCFHSITYAYEARLYVASWLLLIPVCVVIQGLISGESDFTARAFSEFVVTMVAIAGVYLIDFIHSTVLGLLVGILAPTVTRNRQEARVGAFFTFLTLQLGAYLLMWLLNGVLVAPVLPGRFSDMRLFWLGNLAAAGLNLLIFFAVREIMIRLLWRVAQHRLNVVPADLIALMSGKLS